MPTDPERNGVGEETALLPKLKPHRQIEKLCRGMEKMTRKTLVVGQIP